jgi:CCR4-NOT transcriptional regulation complex NOT5 subunit
VDYDTKYAVFYLFAINATIPEHKFMKTIRTKTHTTLNRISICSHTVIVTNPQGVETKLDMSIVKTLASRIDLNDLDSAPTLFTVLFSHKQDDIEGTPAEYIIAAMRYRQEFMDISIYNYEKMTDKVKRVLSDHGISYHVIPVLTNWLGFKLNTPRSLSEEARLPASHSTGGSTITTTSVRRPPRADLSDSDLQFESVGSETSAEGNPTGNQGIDETVSCSNRKESTLQEVLDTSEGIEEAVVKDPHPHSTSQDKGSTGRASSKSDVKLHKDRSSSKRRREKRKRSKRPHTESAGPVLPEDCDADKEAAVLRWGTEPTPTGKKSYADAVRTAIRD